MRTRSLSLSLAVLDEVAGADRWRAEAAVLGHDLRLAVRHRDRAE